MDIVRLRLSRSQSAIQVKNGTGSGSRPLSSHTDSACASKARPRPATSIPTRRSNFADFRDDRQQKPEYLMSGKRIQPTETPLHRPKTGKREILDSDTDVTSCNSQYTRTTSARAKSARNQQSSTSGGLGPGHLEIRLALEDLDIAKPESLESWLRAFERKRLRTYTAILREEEQLLEQLTNVVNIKGVQFRNISLGSLIVHAHFEDIDAFNNFKESHRCGRLKDELNQVLVTDELLQEVGVDGVAMSAHVQTADVRRCHQELNARKPTNRKSSTNGVQNGCDQASPKIQCVTKINFIQSSLEMSIDAVRQKYEAFLKKLEKFLMVLKLTKPLDIEVYTCLDDVMKCFEFLQASESIGRNVRTDLVREYLALVNVLRVKVIEVRHDLQPITEQIVKYGGKAAWDEVMAVCEHLEGQYDTSFPFAEMQDTGGTIDMGVMDTQLFKGLVAYIPWLLAQTDQLYKGLDDLRAKISTDRAQGEKQLIDVRFRRSGSAVQSET